MEITTYGDHIGVEGKFPGGVMRIYPIFDGGVIAKVYQGASDNEQIIQLRSKERELALITVSHVDYLAELGWWEDADILWEWRAEDRKEGGE